MNVDVHDSKREKVSVCIATYCRPQQLRELLADLALQKWTPYEIVVVDNDPKESARSIVAERLMLGMPCPVIYGTQRTQNISLTRNKTVELATGDWLAFIDDDERAPSIWLKELMATVDLHAAEGALGPVIPKVPTDAPAWIRRGHFYDWPRRRTGRVVPLNCLRFGNVVLRADCVKQFAAPFDVAYGLTGGEDGDLLTRLANRGARIVWCDEAIVIEPVVQSRLSLAWLGRRALRGGQDFARHSLAGRYGPATTVHRLKLIGRATAQALIAALLSFIALPLGRHVAAHWLLKAAANVGKLSIFFGWHYREYAKAAQAQPTVIL